MRQIEYRTSSQIKIPVVFLLSPQMLSFYKIRLRNFDGNHEEYLKLLVNRSSRLSPPGPGKILTGYQARNLALRRYSMRLPVGLYVKIGQIAAFLGVSRCLLVALLIEQDQASYGFVRMRETRNAQVSQFMLFIRLEFSSDGVVLINRRWVEHRRLTQRLFAGIRMLL